MSKYMILKFEHDDEFGCFTEELELCLAWLSNPPYKVKVVGEAKPELFSALTGLYRVVPIGKTNNQATER